MNKVRIVQAVTSLGSSQGALIPSLGTGETKVKTITLEGSSSMFDPIEILNNNLSSERLELNILPSGAARGKEAYDENEADFALVSIDERKGKNPGPYKIFNENTETEKGNQQIYFAQDPLVFLYKKDKSCTTKENELYKPYTLFSVAMGKLKDNEEDGKNYKGNRKELMNLFKEGSGKFSECNFSAYSREGSNERSNLNKTLFKTPEDGVVDGLIDSQYDIHEMKKKLGNNIEKIWKKEQQYYETINNNGYYSAKVSSGGGIKGNRLSENNWLAFRQWTRRAKPGDITFFPMSFIDSNLDWISKKEIRWFTPQDPETITDVNNIEEEDNEERSEPGEFAVGSKRKKYVFKRKFYLQYNKKNNLNSMNEKHREWVENILLNNKQLMNQSQLFVPEYYKEDSQSNDGNSGKKKINIKELFTNNSN